MPCPHARESPDLTNVGDSPATTSLKVSTSKPVSDGSLAASSSGTVSSILQTSDLPVLTGLNSPHADRVTAHSAIVDFAKDGRRRHGARITPQAEKPFL
jgi:hypothetical protein